MDKKVLDEFIKTTDEKFLRKYAKLVTNMLTKGQLMELSQFFELKINLKGEEEKVDEKPKKQAKKKTPNKRYSQEEVEAMIESGQSNDVEDGEDDEIDFTS